MPFLDPASLKTRNLAPGVTLRLAWGERIMLSIVQMEPGRTVSLHSHPHEQAGIVLEGEFELQIGGERRLLRKGDLYLIPSNVEHGVTHVPVPAVALDIFSPPRDDYKT